jgi:hypothetical protein
MYLYGQFVRFYLHSPILGGSKMIDFELCYVVYIAWHIVDVKLVKFTKTFMFDKIFPFQTKFTTLLVSNIPSSLLSRFWESDSDVKLIILEEASTGSCWWSDDRIEIEVSLIVSAPIDKVSPASTIQIKNKQREKKS